MTAMNKCKTAIAAAAILALGACATTTSPTTTSRDYGSNSSAPVGASSRNDYTNYGVVQSIDLVRQDTAADKSLGLGTVAGAVVGGIVGHQVGDGRGKDVATVAGAAGGAYVGHQMEKNNRQQQPDTYQFTIRMNNGSFQTLTQNSAADFRVGDRVQIDNGTLRRY